MLTFPRSTIFAALVAVAAVAAADMVDDSDSRIEYVGSWVKNPIPDPANFNYAGSLTFTDSTAAKASFTFTGAIQVAVFGSFPTVGTFTLHSRYTIDGADPVSFMPPSTITRPEYRQEFYASATLTPGTHTLTIENLGQEFYLDYILLTPAPASSSSSSPPPQVPTVQTPTTASPTPTQNPAPVSHGLSSTNTPSDVQSTSETTHADSASQSMTVSGSSSYSATLTSSGSFVAGFSSTPFADGTDITASSSPIASSSGSGGAPADVEDQGSQGLMPGAYIAIGIASLILLVICIVGGMCLWRRRKRIRTKADVTPFDPGLLSLASDDSESEKRMLARDSDYRSSSGATAPPYSLADELHREESGRRRQSLDSAASGLGDGVQDEESREHGRTGLTGYEALTSPSSTSPLISSERRSALSPVASSPTVTVQPTKSRNFFPEATSFGRRRSLDGGVRIAGGPPGMRRVTDLDEMEVRSAASTLPPLYQPYLPS